MVGMCVGRLVGNDVGNWDGTAVGRARVVGCRERKSVGPVVGEDVPLPGEGDGAELDAAATKLAIYNTHSYKLPDVWLLLPILGFVCELLRSERATVPNVW